MALKDYDSRYNPGYARERRGDNNQDRKEDPVRGRMSQRQRGSQDYSNPDYWGDSGERINYGERYGFSGYGRAHYDPDINRGWEDNPEMYSWRESQPFTNREQDYRGGQWSRATHSYEPRFSEPSHAVNLHESVWRGEPISRDAYSQSNRYSYAGVGPKNYKRSDARIHEDVCDVLTQHSEIDASNIEVMVSNGEVTLSGSVFDRRMKRHAEDVIDAVPGVVDVSNQIRVGREAESSAYSLSDRVSNERRGSDLGAQPSSRTNGNGSSRKSRAI